MEPDRLKHSYSVLFDERQESWYVAHPHSRRIPLSRTTLQQFVALYNEIHRGAPLALSERRALDQLGAERSELQETIRSLYDYIDATAARTNPAGRPAALRRCAAFLGYAAQAIWRGLRRRLAQLR